MWEESSSISTQISGGSENKADGNNSMQLKSKNIIPEQEEEGNNSVPLKLKNRITEEGGDRLLLWEWKNLKTKNSSSNSRRIDLGNGSEVEYYPNFVDYEDAWRCFNYINTHIPWTRPTLRVFGRDCVQPRDSCYVASDGLPKLMYSGYQPHAYSWNHFPPLNHILQAVQDAVPGSRFNSLLLNRYKGGNDYVGWHSDDELLYGPTPLIASLSFGCERPFFLKKKPPKPSRAQPVSAKNSKDEPVSKRLKKSKSDSTGDQHSFTLKHGSLLVMRGYTQRDWIHSVPKRAKVDAVRINLTFRLVL